MQKQAVEAHLSEYKPHVSEFRRFCRVFFKRGLVKFGFIVIVIFLIVAAASPLIAPYQPNKQNLEAYYQILPASISLEQTNWEEIS